MRAQLSLARFDRTQQTHLAGSGVKVTVADDVVVDRTGTDDANATADSKGGARITPEYRFIPTKLRKSAILVAGGDRGCEGTTEQRARDRATQ